MQSTEQTLAVVRAYYDGWSAGRMDEAVAMLADELVVEVPINEYPDKDSFAAAVARFAGVVSHAELIAELANDDEAMLLYDMDVKGIGPLRIAEHFTVAGGRIVRIRQIHDTATLRNAGFG